MEPFLSIKGAKYKKETLYEILHYAEIEKFSITGTFSIRSGSASIRSHSGSIPSGFRLNVNGSRLNVNGFRLNGNDSNII
jgi:hypothetical protein